jgi:pantoate--beta-alanine ligase
METLSQLSALRERIRAWRHDGDTIALVPTMGNLHAGHLALVAEARRRARRVVVSIFVNPLQFGPTEDFSVYPRTPEADAEKLRDAGADLLFMPGVNEMYPSDAESMTQVEVPGLSDDLCGRFRPGHFRGVATVVLKLFNQVQPDTAVFGDKDYQQLTIIRRMVADLNVPVEVVGVPTIREPDGLAMSSRNAYLTQDERGKAALLHARLRLAAEQLAGGARDFARVEQEHAEALQAAGFEVDYFAVREPKSLAAPQADDHRWIILVAARLGRTRLIDNLCVSRGPAA